MPSAAAAGPGLDAPDVWAIDARSAPFQLGRTARCALWPLRGEYRMFIDQDPTAAPTGRAKSQSSVPIFVYSGPFPH